ncbi:MAG: helix-turn-helix domain-containing protein [Alphaproteobacteria bacterium]
MHGGDHHLERVMTVTSGTRTFGEHLKQWRSRRRLSQLKFSLESGISQKHLSFIEVGRSSPSREMVIHLSECLEIPLRERNTMLLAAGYAPLYPARELDDPTLQPARAAIRLLLKGHEPFPALAVDRHWTMIDANRVIPLLFTGLSDPALLTPPINVLRLSLHPNGLAPHIVNLSEWRMHLLRRLGHQINVTGDEVLMRLVDELQAYPCEVVRETFQPTAHDYSDIFVPMELTTPLGRLSFFSTTTVFGTPLDVTLSELAIESFFPANEETRRILAEIDQQR